MEYVNAYVDGPNIVLLHRDEGGKLKKSLSPAEYVTYLRHSDVPEEMRRQFASSTNVRSLKKEGDWLRVGWRDAQVRDMMCRASRGGMRSPLADISTFEGDVHPIRRLLTDTGAKIQKPRRCYFDLETDSRVPFSRKEEMRILSYAIVDDTGARISNVLEAEENRAEHDLIAEFWAMVAQYDQLIAWNGDNFDFDVLRARSDQMGVRVNMRNWLYLDHLTLFKRMNSAESGAEKQSMKLQNIAMATIGEGKDDFDASKTYEAWAAGGESRKRLLEYNNKDTDLLRKIEAKTGFVDLFNTLADVCRVFPESRGLNPTIQMDGYMLRLGMERGLHFPTKQFREGIEQFKGAFVMEPNAKGILRNVHVADFAALYPSIILTWNMSPETKLPVTFSGESILPEGCCFAPLTRQAFRAGANGILPTALRELIRLRKFWNEKKAALPPGTPEWYDADRRSTAYKVAANSFYGVVGSPFSRYFDKAIAESVTQNGVWLIKKTIEAAENKWGMKIVYGDTDSLFAWNATRTQFEEFVKWCNSDLYPELLRSVGCATNEIKLAYEKQFDRIVFCGAKRYAGNYVHYKGKDATANSKPEIKGLEFKRGDTAKLARELQATVIDMLMSGQENADQFKGLLDGSLGHILHDELSAEEAVLSKSLTKPLKDYESKLKIDGTNAAELSHVQVAKVLQERGQEVGEGTRIEFFVVDGTPGRPNVVKPGADYGEHDVDRYYLWESLVYPPTKRLLQSAFPDYDWTSGYEKIRPARPRVFNRKPVPGQLSFVQDVTAPTAKPRYDAPFEVLIRERMGIDMIDALHKIARKHPGPRPLVVHIELESGARAVLDITGKVSGEPAMRNEIETAKFLTLAAYEAVEVMVHA